MQDDWILSGQATSSSSRCWFLAALLSAPVSETLQVKPRTHFSGVSSGCLGFTTSSKFPTTDLSSSFLGRIIWKRSSTSKSYSPAPVLETLKSTTLYISTTDAISQKFQTTGAWALPPRKTWWIGHTLGMLVNGENIWHTVVLQPQFITAFFIPALQSSLLFLPFLTLHIACLFSLKKEALNLSEMHWGTSKASYSSFQVLVSPDPPLCCGLCMPAPVTWLCFHSNSGLSNHLRYDLYSLEERGGGG